MADGVVSRLRQLNAERRASLFQEGVRDLHQDAGAVAGERIRADRAAMGKVLEDLQAMLDDLVARPCFQIGDETDTAGIVLAGRIIESLRRRHARGPRALATRTWPEHYHGTPKLYRTLWAARVSSPRPSIGRIRLRMTPRLDNDLASRAERVRASSATRQDGHRLWGSSTKVSKPVLFVLKMTDFQSAHKRDSDPWSAGADWSAARWPHRPKEGRPIVPGAPFLN